MLQVVQVRKNLLQSPRYGRKAFLTFTMQDTGRLTKFFNKFQPETNPHHPFRIHTNLRGSDGLCRRSKDGRGRKTHPKVAEEEKSGESNRYPWNLQQRSRASPKGSTLQLVHRAPLSSGLPDLSVTTTRCPSGKLATLGAHGDRRAPTNQEFRHTWTPAFRTTSSTHLFCATLNYGH